MALKVIFLIAVFFISCASSNEEELNFPTEARQVAIVKEQLEMICPMGQTIKERFHLPKGYKRIPVDSASFAWYLRHLPLKEEGSPVLHFDGSQKNRQEVHAAVIDIDTGERDLQQCADAVMRLRAEYLWAHKRYDDISFKFNNGFAAAYAKWRAGNRISVKGNKVSWYPISRKQTSYKDFRSYLNMVFAYAGTYSLSKELKKVSFQEMEIGDVFVQGGSPGHAVLVVDMAEQKGSGDRIFLLAQSYMPAQDIHVLKNWNSPNGSPWYAISSSSIDTPEWNFKAEDLKRF
ncbi:MAG: DUF4846 domain-containing protein [Saprospiraceae bacterium]|jgi:hypothetical protein|nr:DUF4846 domain-containing protein [Saprospiraceae bacterium]